LAFPPEKIKNDLGEWLSKKGKSQLRIAETEKYAHVTFFFNNTREAPFENEERKLIPSPKVATYDLQPEMSIKPVYEFAASALKKHSFDLIVLNFANCDMVGHTGSMKAARAAVANVDKYVKSLCDIAVEEGGVAVVTADHGNADKMKDEKGNPFTAHTTAPVPFIVTDPSIKLASGGKLCDIAPTLLEIMGIPQPPEMTGRSLIEK
ncbi:MAG: 2,3-bisphosphoglycerate-independent phosphoglycerate mutase, partial [Clostridia bacterium]|nr:2,3-bisphosphoglycerate-independent phosphoglycerate mutase [Clostridia bacterium]